MTPDIQPTTPEERALMRHKAEGGLRMNIPQATDMLRLIRDIERRDERLAAQAEEITKLRAVLDTGNQAALSAIRQIVELESELARAREDSQQLRDRLRDFATRCEGMVKRVWVPDEEGGFQEHMPGAVPWWWLEREPLIEEALAALEPERDPVAAFDEIVGALPAIADDEVDGKQLAAQAEEIARLRKDSERLDWLQSDKADVRYDPRSGDYYIRWRVGQGEVRGTTPREAIDAAMKGDGE